MQSRTSERKDVAATAHGSAALRIFLFLWCLAAPLRADAQHIEMTISAPTTVIQPKVELVVHGFSQSTFDIMDLPPVTLKRNGTDVSSWLTG